VEVLAVEGNRLHLRDMEAVNGTPVVDIKCVL
jgi:tRNA (Thr-GGU) A37 N-methylase